MKYHYNMDDLVSRFTKFAKEISELQIKGKESQAIKEGGWTVAQVIHHIADATLMYLSRVMLVLSNDNPTLVPFDQDRLAGYGFSSDVPSIATIEIPFLQSLCNKFAMILQTHGIQEKKGYHPEIGEVPLRELASRCIEHNEHHLLQLKTALQ